MSTKKCECDGVAVTRKTVAFVGVSSRTRRGFLPLRITKSVFVDDGPLVERVVSVDKKWRVFSGKRAMSVVKVLLPEDQAGYFDHQVELAFLRHFMPENHVIDGFLIPSLLMVLGTIFGFVIQKRTAKSLSKEMRDAGDRIRASVSKKMGDATKDALVTAISSLFSSISMASVLKAASKLMCIYSCVNSIAKAWSLSETLTGFVGLLHACGADEWIIRNLQQLAPTQEVESTNMGSVKNHAYSDNISWVLNIVLTFVASIFVGKTKAKIVDAFFKVAPFTGLADRSKKGAGAVVEKLTDYVSRFIVWLFKGKDCDAIRKLHAEMDLKDRRREYVGKVPAWVAETNSLLARGASTIESLTDANLLTTVKGHLDEGRALYDVIGGMEEFPLPQKMSLAAFIRDLEKLYQKLVELAGASSRCEPSTVYIAGPPSAGKSHVANVLMGLLARRLGQEDVFKKNKFHFARSPGTNFWDGYGQQTCVMYDDLFKDCLNPKSEDRDAAEWINIVSCQAFPAEQAALADKGMHFTSEFVVATSNYAFPKTKMNVGAVYRRFHQQILMIWAGDGRDRSRHADFSNVRFYRNTDAEVCDLYNGVRASPYSDAKDHPATENEFANWVHAAHYQPVTIRSIVDTWVAIRDAHRASRTTVDAQIDLFDDPNAVAPAAPALTPPVAVPRLNPPPPPGSRVVMTPGEAAQARWRGCARCGKGGHVAKFCRAVANHAGSDSESEDADLTAAYEHVDAFTVLDGSFSEDEPNYADAVELLLEVPDAYFAMPLGDDEPEYGTFDHNRDWKDVVESLQCPAEKLAFLLVKKGGVFMQPMNGETELSGVMEYQMESGPHDPTSRTRPIRAVSEGTARLFVEAVAATRLEAKPSTSAEMYEEPVEHVIENSLFDFNAMPTAPFRATIRGRMDGRTETGLGLEVENNILGEVRWLHYEAGEWVYDAEVHHTAAPWMPHFETEVFGLLRDHGFVVSWRDGRMFVHAVPSLATGLVKRTHGDDLSLIVTKPVTVEWGYSALAGRFSCKECRFGAKYFPWRKCTSCKAVAQKLLGVGATLAYAYVLGKAVRGKAPSQPTNKCCPKWTTVWAVVSALVMAVAASMLYMAIFFAVSSALGWLFSLFAKTWNHGRHQVDVRDRGLMSQEEYEDLTREDRDEYDKSLLRQIQEFRQYQNDKKREGRQRRSGNDRARQTRREGRTKNKARYETASASEWLGADESPNLSAFDRLCSHLVEVHYSGRALFGVHVAGNSVLCPGHLFRKDERDQATYRLKIVYDDDEFEEVVERSAMTFPADVDLPEGYRADRTDVVMISLKTLPAQRKILTGFATTFVGEKESAMDVDCAILKPVIRDSTLGNFDYYCELTSVKGFPEGELSSNGPERLRTDVYRTDANMLKMGDCGTLLFVEEGGAVKIAGIYVAGSQSHGYFQPVTRDLLEALLPKAKNYVAGFAQAAPVAAPPPPDAIPGVCGHRNLGVYLFDSPENRHLGPSGIEPSHFQKTNARLFGHGVSTLPCVGDKTALRKAMAKKMKPGGVHDPVTLRRAQDMLEDMFRGRVSGLEPLTPEAALTGTTLIPNMTMASSPGLPWVKDRPRGETGRAYLFDAEQAGYGRKLFRPKPELQSAIDRHWSNWEKGEANVSVFKGTLKDERRDLQRILDKKVRIFTACPVEKVICDRRLLGPFYEKYKEGRREFMHGIGIDPTGAEWDELAREHLVFPNHCALDYSNFDSSLPLAFTSAAYEVIAGCYKPEFRNMVRASGVESTNAHYYVDGCLYKQPKGNPSGHFLTTVLNSLVNTLFFFYVYIQLNEVRGAAYMNNVRVFREHIVLHVYGDDVIFSVSERMGEVFNGETFPAPLKAFGVTATSADKCETVRRWTPWPEVTFLKRDFAKTDVVGAAGLYLGRLPKDIIEEIPMWQWKGAEIDDVASTVVNALMEAWLWGPAYFDWYWSCLLSLKDGLSREILKRVSVKEVGDIVCSRFNLQATVRGYITFCFADKEFGFLSNLSVVPGGFEHGGRSWTSVEQAYVSAKIHKCVESVPDLAKIAERDLQRLERANGHACKSIGRAYKSPEWEKMREAVLKELVTAKFKANKGWRNRLLDTGTDSLIEATTDRFWGAGMTESELIRAGFRYPGRNAMGRILEEVRVLARTM